MTLDLEKIRADIPSTPRLIHFNNAGTSLMASPVYQSMLDYLDLEQQIGGYEAAKLRQADTDSFYQATADMINCRPDEIAFCESASRAWQCFFYSLDFKPGDKVITTQLDYGSNFVGFIQQQKRLGIEIVVIPVDSAGEVDLDLMRSALDDKVKLISLSHIPTANGIINPAAEIGRMAQEAEVPFLLDACQSVGQIEVDVKAIGCTALSATGRKYIRGPRGTGFLYVQRDFANKMNPVMLDQHGVQLQNQSEYIVNNGASRFENFECNFGARIGLGNALQYASNIGMENIAQRIVLLGDYCRQQLSTIPNVVVQDTGTKKGGIVMFSITGTDPEAVQRQLAEKAINIWVSAGPGSLVDYQARGLDRLLRASLHYFNTEQEIDQMINNLGSVQ